MSKTRKSARSRLIHISLSDIRYDTICVNIPSGGPPTNFSYEICSSRLDIHSKKSKSMKKRATQVSNKSM